MKVKFLGFEGGIEYPFPWLTIGKIYDDASFVMSPDKSKSVWVTDDNGEKTRVFESEYEIIEL